jgi:hypothetical protein
MSEGLTFAGFAAMFRLGPEKITMTKADAVRLAEVAQVASDEITRLRAENARLREALRLGIDAVEFWAAYATSYFQDKHDLAGDLQKLRVVLGEKE